MSKKFIINYSTASAMKGSESKDWVIYIIYTFHPAKISIKKSTVLTWSLKICGYIGKPVRLSTTTKKSLQSATFVTKNTESNAVWFFLIAQKVNVSWILKTFLHDFKNNQKISIQAFYHRGVN